MSNRLTPIIGLMIMTLVVLTFPRVVDSDLEGVVKTQDSSTIWQVENGTCLAFPAEETFLERGFSFEQVQTVTQNDLSPCTKFGEVVSYRDEYRSKLEKLGVTFFNDAPGSVYKMIYDELSDEENVNGMIISFETGYIRCGSVDIAYGCSFYIPGKIRMMQIDIGSSNPNPGFTIYHEFAHLNGVQNEQEADRFAEQKLSGN